MRWNIIEKLVLTITSASLIESLGSFSFLECGARVTRLKGARDQSTNVSRLYRLIRVHKSTVGGLAGLGLSLDVRPHTTPLLYRRSQVPKQRLDF